MHPEQVTVTIQTASLSFSADFELPADLPAEQLSVLILEALKQLSTQIFGTWNSLRIIHNNRELENGDTLASLSAWDGSILTVTEGQV